MKCETIDMNFKGKNFRDYVHTSDISSAERHFQEGIILKSIVAEGRSVKDTRKTMLLSLCPMNFPVVTYITEKLSSYS
jgi:hypothetical protein